MILLVGLGNPGNEYAKNRHNTGFLVLDKIAQETGSVLSEDKYMFSSLGKSEDFLLAKPLTYINDSGRAVAKIIEKYTIPTNDLWVVHDDTEIAVGEVRIKFAGTSGGHNGIKSLDNELSTNNYWRIRVGVGRPENPNYDLADYVLADFPSNGEAVLNSVIDQTATYLLKCLKEGRLEATTFSLNNGKKTTQ